MQRIGRWQVTRSRSAGFTGVLGWATQNVERSSAATNQDMAGSVDETTATTTASTSREHITSHTASTPLEGVCFSMHSPEYTKAESADENDLSRSDWLVNVWSFGLPVLSIVRPHVRRGANEMAYRKHDGASTDTNLSWQKYPRALYIQQGYRVGYYYESTQTRTTVRWRTCTLHRIT